MALQLLKRNYVMQGYECPKILKLPQGETRWAPKRTPVDVGDVMMNIRMDDSKNKYIGEHVSKYAQGSNPYGEWGTPYKVNKQFRPPIIDPKFYEPLSRMPVKFNAVTAGPIVRSTYQKKVDINKVAPKTIMDKVCTSKSATPSKSGIARPTSVCEKIELALKQPKTAAGYNPSIPVYHRNFNTTYELDPKIVTRASAGIHAPYNISDQSRDVHNMRTPTHIAMNPNMKGIYGATLDNEWMRQGPDLTPKVQTSAWYNPSYFLGNVGDAISDVSSCTRDQKMNVAGTTNVSWTAQESERGKHERQQTKLNLGDFSNGATVPQIQAHPEYRNNKQTLKQNVYSPVSSTPNFQQSKNSASSGMKGHVNGKLSFSFDTKGK